MGGAGVKEFAGDRQLVSTVANAGVGAAAGELQGEIAGKSESEMRTVAGTGGVGAVGTPYIEGVARRRVRVKK